MIFDQKFPKSEGSEKFSFLLDFFFILQKLSLEKIFPLIDAEMYKLSIAGIFSSFLYLGAEL